MATAVVPHAGTWIEIYIAEKQSLIEKSFPTRERGLKWLRCKEYTLEYCRSPRGNVD